MFEGPSMAEDRSEASDYSSEDEGTEDYRRGGYHAVRIGDTFKNGSYVVQSKLGWGPALAGCRSNRTNFRLIWP